MNNFCLLICHFQMPVQSFISKTLIWILLLGLPAVVRIRLLLTAIVRIRLLPSIVSARSRGRIRIDVHLHDLAARRLHRHMVGLDRRDRANTVWQRIARHKRSVDRVNHYRRSAIGFDHTDQPWHRPLAILSLPLLVLRLKPARHSGGQRRQAHIRKRWRSNHHLLDRCQRRQVKARPKWVGARVRKRSASKRHPLHRRYGRSRSCRLCRNYLGLWCRNGLCQRLRPGNGYLPARTRFHSRPRACRHPSHRLSARRTRSDGDVRPHWRS